MRRARLAAAATAVTTIVGVAACAETDDAGSEAVEPGTAPTVQDTEAPAESPATAEPEVSVETVEPAPGEPPTGEQPPAPPGAAGQAPWVGPPENELGQPVDLDRVVAEGGDAVVALTDLTGYSTGALLEVSVRVDPAVAEGGAAPGADPMGLIGPGGASDAAAEDLLRIEVTYPDGSVASTVDDPDDRGGEPEGPVLTRSTGQGTGTAWEYDLWLWPLPEGDGALELALLWPEQGIETREDVDASALVSAAGESTELWPAGGSAP